MKFLTYISALLLSSLALAQPSTAPSNFRLIYPGPPTPAMVASRNLPTVGAITATANQIISNVHVTTASGPCITVTNQANVIIQDSEIGPCGDGSDAQHLCIVTTGATNIAIRRNVLHDCASGAYLTGGAGGSGHPFAFHKNYTYNIRGPFPRGNLIQTNGITSGTGASKITCNVSDMMPGVRYGVEHATWTNVEDHINLFATQGINSTTNRVEIAYNRLRGGHPSSTSGASINVGDGNGSNTYSHDNIIVNVRSVGISIWDGSNHTMDNNRVYMDTTPWGAVNWGITGCAQQVGNGGSCSNNTVSNNRIRELGGLTTHCEGTCGSGTTLTNNNYSDTSLTEAMFDEAWHSSCN